MRKILIVLSIVFLAFASLKSESQTKDHPEYSGVKVVNGQFIRNGSPYFYIGANYWYGGILGSKGKEGNRKRLTDELI